MRRQFFLFMGGVVEYDPIALGAFLAFLFNAWWWSRGK